MYYIKNSSSMFKAIKTLMDKNIQTKGEYFLVDAFNLMIKAGQTFTTKAVNVWLDTGKPVTMLATNRYLLDHGCSNKTEPDGNIIIPPVFIAESAVIEGSIVGPYVTVADNSHIRHSIVSDSIVEEDSDIHHAILHRSLIGVNAKVRGTSHILNVGDSSQVDYIQQEPKTK
jgi:glucose-1-phosphate thymidylyltransferase